MIEKARPDSSGKKPKTRRTAAAESRKSVATFAVAAQVQPGSTDVPTEEQFARLLEEKPKVFRHRWHNNEPVYLAFLSDLARGNLRCVSCNLELNRVFLDISTVPNTFPQLI